MLNIFGIFQGFSYFVYRYFIIRLCTAIVFDLVTATHFLKNLIFSISTELFKAKLSYFCAYIRYNKACYTLVFDFVTLTLIIDLLLLKLTFLIDSELYKMDISYLVYIFLIARYQTLIYHFVTLGLSRTARPC